MVEETVKARLRLQPAVLLCRRPQTNAHALMRAFDSLFGDG
jgi:hypothetical protein